MTTLETTLTKVENEFELILFAVIVLSYLLGLVEIIYEFISKKMSWTRFKETMASVFVAIPSVFTNKFTESAFLLLYFYLYQITPWKLEVSWWALFIVILLVDFIHYWGHRWEHQIRFLWTAHSVHHSSPIFNISTSFRVVFYRSLFDIIYYLPLVALGFHPILVLLGLAMVAVYQIWIHNDTIGKMGPVEWLFNTPSHHRVHHANTRKYIDKNYGGILIIWDKLFGTFQVEEEKPTYGLSKQINSINPWTVHFHEVGNLCKDLRAAKSAQEYWGYLFKRPGWKPSHRSSPSTRD